MPRALVLASSLLLSLLVGCDMLGIESPEKVAAARDADGKAIGGACRHAGRAIEDCYALYRKADRAAIFAGWRDMNDYMRENKIEPVTPELSTPPARADKGEKAEKVAVAEKGEGERVDKPAKGKRADKMDKVAKSDKAEDPEKADRSDKVDKPEKPAKAS